MSQRWSIEQLAALVEKTLETSGYDGQRSARVRTVPDLRTIRYYTTLGILSPPAEMRGRKALYGPLHLLQLTAIKRLQQQGLSLVQVQQKLAGASQQDLERWVALPKDFWDRLPRLLSQAALRSPGAAPDQPQAESLETGPGVRGERRAFWAAPPELGTVPNGRPPAEQGSPRSATHLPICDGAELVLHGIDSRRLDAATIARLGPAIERLVDVLRPLLQDRGK